MKAGTLLLLATFLLAYSQSGFAADRTEIVKFNPGASSADKKSSIKGYDGVDYRIAAREGQIMQVLFSPSNRSCYMNVLPPGGDAAIFNGSVSGNEFSRNLTATGTYRVQVYLMRNAARRGETCNFAISFEITG